MGPRPAPGHVYVAKGKEAPANVRAQGELKRDQNGEGDGATLVPIIPVIPVVPVPVVP
ncbi:hypothetical protein [Paractinoplanes lichenicola]|uniref:Uncharacterized protein n=1 Tax=Paractinoplanes lichenicola TaxID=2802976 RepID=A0ABS1W0M8_9ACTN|nr:hypothetical protein [Actinoplanes lichenicola]MBL7260285.1 hypothetical protein [Actinoplanes lichenicola]